MEHLWAISSPLLVWREIIKEPFFIPLQSSDLLFVEPSSVHHFFSQKSYTVGRFKGALHFNEALNKAKLQNREGATPTLPIQVVSRYLLVPLEASLETKLQVKTPPQPFAEQNMLHQLYQMNPIGMEHGPLQNLLS